MRRKRKNAYKFGDKKHSRRGKVSLALAVLSLIAGIGMVSVSIQNGGNANEYVGSAGLFSMMVCFVSLMVGLTSLREDSYKLFPVLGSVCSGLTLAGWAAIYALGFFIL